MKKKALIIDGNSIINRAFYGIKGMSTPDGFPTNAIYGFLNIYNSVQSEVKADYVAVAFDLKGPTHRHSDFADYKAGRKGMPDELAMQLPVLKQILEALGIKIMELAGFEADDILGSAAEFLKAEQIQTYLLTGDKDALQLVDDNTFVYYHGSKQKLIYDAEAVKQDMGVYPERVVELKALMGDKSDNIPGVTGIGQVTALKLLAEFKDVEDLIANSDKISKPRWRNLVEQYAEDAILSKKLATIIRDMPLSFELEDFAITPPNQTELLTLLKKYRLNRFINSLHLEAEAKSADDSSEKASVQLFDFSVFRTAEGLDEFLAAIDFKKAVYLQTLYDKEHIFDDQLLTIALVQADKRAVFSQEAVSYVIDYLEQISQKNELIIIGNKLKQTMLILKRYQIDNLKPLFDPQIAMYLIDANRSQYNLADLALDMLGIEIMALDSLLGKGKKRKKLAELSAEQRIDFLKGQMTALVQLHPLLSAELEKQKMNELFQEIEMPLSLILADLEFEGINVDTKILDKLELELVDLIADLEQKIYALAGREFNINSPKQLGVILFEELELPVLKKTKTGYSTNHDILLKLEKKHEIISHIIEYRSYSKLRSTYVDGLRAVINPISHKIHSSFNQTVAATGRLSSKEPNLQNIPVRLAFGRRLRKVFVASPDNILVDADYSQIELRILAEISQDPSLLQAYLDDIDIHTLTAAKVFNKDISEVDSLMRSRAKEVNFGIVYGMSDFGLSETLRIPVKTAKEYIANYFAKYPLVKAYMQKSVADCRQNGYAETLFGRRREIKEINNRNHNLRQYGERMAMNTPIQGTAADIIKKAMVDVYWGLKEAGLNSKLILQVHDELIIDTVPAEREAVEKILITAMEAAADLSVPLKVDLNTGKNWYDAK